MAKTKKNNSGETAQQRRRKKATPEEKRVAAVKAARKARLQWVIIVAIGVAIIGGVVGVSIWDARPREGVTTVGGWDLPVRDNDPNGDGRITLAEFAGKPVVLNFYADWCSACEDELPAFSAAANDLGDQIHFVHVNSQETGDWHRLVDDFGTDWWPIAQDINGREGGGSGLWDSLGGRGMPITAFYDAAGRLVFTNQGAMSEGGLRGVIAQEFGIT